MNKLIYEINELIKYHWHNTNNQAFHNVTNVFNTLIDDLAKYKLKNFDRFKVVDLGYV